MSDVKLPAHLLEVLDTMSQEMGVPRDALVSQAVFQFARLSGYLIAGKATSRSGAKLAAPSLKGAEPEEEPLPEDEEGNPFDEPMEEAPEEPYLPEDEPPLDDEPQVEEEPRGPTMMVVLAGREPYKMTRDQVLLGRGKHCDFVIESNRVSREHARFTRKGNDFFVEDLGSSNGTFVGAGSKEKLISPKKLKDGDDVTFGTEKVKVSIRR